MLSVPAAPSASATGPIGGGGGGGGVGNGNPASITASTPPATTVVVSQATFAPTDTDQAQFEADKRAVYKHPLFPLLALLFERCELATQSPEPQSSDAFNLDIQAFVQHQERDRKPFLANEPEIDGLMIKAIQVLRIHLLELEKVQELCKDFCNRYITCLKGKMQSENLLRSDYPQDMLGSGIINNLESNNNSMMSQNSESGSASNSPIQYSISPSHAVMQQQQPPPHLDRLPPGTSIDNPSYSMPSTYSGGPTPPLQSSAQPSPVPPVAESLLIHGSTPLSQIGAHMCAAVAAAAAAAAAAAGGAGGGGGPTAPPSDSSGPLSPAPTTPGGSNDDCDSDFSRGGKKQKRGVLPKHATSVMRSWLFQHLVHPYPTEDEKRQIAAQTNLTLLQVNNWFINARRRILQPMLDASTPPVGQEGAVGCHGNSPSNIHPSNKKKKNQNNNRRFWPQEFGNIQHNLDSSILSSSDDEGDSYSSEEDGGSGGGGGLIIDAPQQTNSEIQQNNHHHHHHQNVENNLISGAGAVAIYGNGETATVAATAAAAQARQ